MNNKEQKFSGYAVVDKVTGKGIRVYYSHYSDNTYTLTEDVEFISLFGDIEAAELAASAYNKSHKTKIDFEIKKMTRIRIIKLEEE